LSPFGRVRGKAPVGFGAKPQNDRAPYAAKSGIGSAAPAYAAKGGIAGHSKYTKSDTYHTV
jgi:hypothetical protein